MNSGDDHSSRPLDHWRAKHAWDCIEKRIMNWQGGASSSSTQQASRHEAHAQDGPATAESEVRHAASTDVMKGLDEYLTVARGAVIQMRSRGLLQLVAFWNAKDGPKLQVYNDLFSWLCRQDSSQDLGLFPSGGAVHSWDALLRLDSRQVAFLEQESAHFLDWLARIADGERKSRQRVAEEKSDEPVNESA